MKDQVTLNQLVTFAAYAALVLAFSPFSLAQSQESDGGAIPSEAIVRFSGDRQDRAIEYSLSGPVGALEARTCPFECHLAVLVFPAVVNTSEASFLD